SPHACPPAETARPGETIRATPRRRTILPAGTGPWARLRRASSSRAWARSLAHPQTMASAREGSPRPALQPGLSARLLLAGRGGLGQGYGIRGRKGILERLLQLGFPFALLCSIARPRLIPGLARSLLGRHVRHLATSWAPDGAAPQIQWITSTTVRDRGSTMST